MEQPNIKTPNEPLVRVTFQMEPLVLNRENSDSVTKSINELFGTPIQQQLYRICDECKSRTKIHPEATDTIFECNDCKKKFDICVDCQPTSNLKRCPYGYGCLDCPEEALYTGDELWKYFDETDKEWAAEHGKC